MPNIATVLKEEISRLARKEIKSQTEAIRKASAEHRKKIAEMRRQISELQRKVSFLEKQMLKGIQGKYFKRWLPEVPSEDVHWGEWGKRHPESSILK